ncbi:hypothetical protein M951_chr1159 (nucleomorph) [Lotharella oceanica]|uniref:Uncharacterized protein n=1 Tax=Lotharella oceanica TaxID=641309 RepID=A0A060DFN2_9EUKA|nr:hypothetical protein M951_chr1159 [Lotharella oceanica]|mmetsp:Transcript_4466/g.8960  ORF Transcript_4466/g.8960 Transcript_4466/m.8960 type:complete len:109 (+) Transcript_4466:28-354(+)
MLRKRNLTWVYNKFKNDKFVIKKCYNIKFSKKFIEKIYIENNFFCKNKINRFYNFSKKFHFYTNTDIKNTQKYYFFVYNGLILKKIFLYLNIFLFNHIQIRQLLNLII